MQNKNKIIIIIVAIVILIIVVIACLFKKDDTIDILKDNTSFENKEEEVIKDRTVSNILFSNIKYEYNKKENNTTITLDITNNNKDKVILNHFVIKVYDKDKNLIGIFNTINEEILSNGDRLGGYNIIVDTDLKNAKSIEFELPELELIK